MEHERRLLMMGVRRVLAQLDDAIARDDQEEAQRLLAIVGEELESLAVSQARDSYIRELNPAIPPVRRVK